MTDRSDLYQAVLTGDAAAALVAARSALDSGTEPLDLITHSIAPAMRKAGEEFDRTD